VQNINFLQQKELFSLNALKCLRNEYLFNDCQLCFERCEEKALGLFKNKITLFKDSCTTCGACIGSCPTQSLTLEHFDAVDFIFEFLDKQTNIIIEKIDVPHFGVFDSMILISLVLRTKHNIFLEYQTPISQLHLDYIDECIKSSNFFLASIGFEHSLFLKPHKEELQSSRRNLFQSLIKSKDALLKEEHGSQKLNQTKKNLPSKFIFFKNSLKLVCEDIANTFVSTHQLPLFNQKIDFNRCTNCIECITFCPTNALFQNESKESIIFQSGKCIGCDICHQVCKEGAIEENYHLDLIEFMFDRSIKLVEFEYIKCQECNNAFIDKNRGNICFVCSDYTNNFQGMFTLAKDL